MQAIKFAVLDHWADMMVPDYCAEIGPVVPIIARNRGNRLVASSQYLQTDSRVVWLDGWAVNVENHAGRATPKERRFQGSKPVVGLGRIPSGGGDPVEPKSSIAAIAPSSCKETVFYRGDRNSPMENRSIALPTVEGSGSNLRLKLMRARPADMTTFQSVYRSIDLTFLFFETKDREHPHSAYPSPFMNRGCWSADDSLFGQAHTPADEADWVGYTPPSSRFIPQRFSQKAVNTTFQQGLLNV
jgi:hypothetical protein